MVLVSILLVLAIISGIVFMIYPTINTPNEQELTTHDGLEDVVVDEKTIHVKTHDKDRVKEEVIETVTATTDDFIPVEEELKGVGVLTDHIAKVIELHPNSKKHLTRRERKTVDKIVKEKKK